jgi:hypothetical protein
MNTKQRRQKGQKTKPKRLSREEAESLRVCRKAERLYQTKLKALLEPANTGKFVAVEPDSGDYFLADRMVEAVLKAEAKYPDREVFLIRVGFKAAVSFKHPVPIPL